MAAESASQAAESASQVAAPANLENISAITNLSAFKEVISNEEAEKQVRVLTNLYLNSSRGSSESGRRICLLYSQNWKHTVRVVGDWYTHPDRRIPVASICYEEPRWFETMKQCGCSHFIFFGIPPHERQKKRGFRSAKSPIEASSTAVSIFFSPKEGGRKVNDVVVVLQDRLTTRKDLKSRFSEHYLERYLKLNGPKEPTVIAASALGIFAGI